MESEVLLVSKGLELTDEIDTVGETCRVFVLLAPKNELLLKLAPEDGITAVVVALRLCWLVSGKVRVAWNTSADV